MKRECCLIISLVALTLSIVAIFGIHKNVESISDLVLTLLGVCATMIVGVSVMDAIAIRGLIEKEEMKMQELSDRIEELSKLKEKVERTRIQTNILFHHTWGIQQWEKQPYTALAEFWRGFEFAVKSEDCSRAMSCLTNAEDITKDIIDKLQRQEDISNADFDRLPQSIPNKVKKAKVYCAFQDRTENLLKQIRDDIIN